MVFYLSDVISHEPFIISSLVRNSLVNLSIQPIWEGLATGQWSDAELLQFQEALQKINMAKEARRSIDSERAAFGVTLFDYMRSHKSDIGNFFDNDQQLGDLFRYLPNGWLYFEQVSYHVGREKTLLPGMDPDTGRLYPDVIRKNFEAAKSKESLFPTLLHHELLVTMLLPSLQKYYQKVALAETALNEAIIACALERYRLANGKLPDPLDQLVPKFLDHVPMDVCNGQPLIYHPGSGRDFTLYSVGWNLTDDGGKTVLKSGKSADVDISEGDWVWPSYTSE
jgi:hypothetical protein